ncbi:Acyl-CoA dehydrogenase FadE27 [Mycolicibacterium vanbaalenii]|uniref:Acyl-CoA dehydrogenase FadE27 n=1 Tax=Mycolicibacterium vanbaalenii TaxID=110539 RepID=A0A5S9MQM7_MYCVN|nr:acyl-CoA dehydrogenase family protein [Mycolicibacterium vanbaalenii]CAA0079390.1 Acyl-CoA dehydrogenase FadE27 [Mycolicibacterium vanbaalenii]
MTSITQGFALSEEQHDLRRTVRSFLAAKCTEERVREVMAGDSGYDPAVWQQMSDQLALQGLAIPEHFGGLGFSLVELGIVMEEMGRALLPSPFLASVVLAGGALLHSGDESAAQRWLPGIASGRTIATLALTEEAGSWDVDSVTMRAERSGDCWILDGVKNFVLDGHVADMVVVVARTDAGLSLLTVENPTERVNRRTLSTLDPTRRQARLEFTGTPATLVGTDGGAAPTLRRALDDAAAALSAEQVGGAQRCLDMAVEYAKVRRQFGKPIGSFQAIRHRCADMLLDVECARGAAQYALSAAAQNDETLPAAASIAKAYASEAYERAAAANIQIHGGIGFTWEHPAHLYYKRAKSSGHLLGSAGHHRRQLADRTGI